MKVALITDGIWPYVIGGMQKHSYYLCKYFAKNKIDVLLIHTASQLTEEIKNLDCFTQDEKEYISSVFIRKPLVKRFPGHYIYENWLYSKSIFDTLHGFPKVDFIIAKGMTGWYFLKKKTNESPPIAINIHGYEFMQKKAGFKMRIETILLRFPLTRINRMADFVFSYGGKITEYIKKLGIPTSKIIEIPAAVESEWMNENNSGVNPVRQFLFVGRNERRKGIEEINSAIKKLSKTHQFAFSFIGPVPQEKQLSLPGILYHGTIRNKEDLQAILCQSDILVCPSYSEGMPNVILEGMANGCAIIATDVGAVSLLVNEKTGWLIPVADSGALETAIINAIECKDELLMEKKKSAYHWVATKYMWSVVSRQLIQAIEERTKK